MHLFKTCGNICSNKFKNDDGSWKPLYEIIETGKCCNHKTKTYGQIQQIEKTEITNEIPNVFDQIQQ